MYVCSSDPFPGLQTHRPTLLWVSPVGILNLPGPKPNSHFPSLQPAPSLGFPRLRWWQFILTVVPAQNFRTTLGSPLLRTHMQSIGKAYLRERSRLWSLLTTSSASAPLQSTVPSLLGYGTSFLWQSILTRATRVNVLKLKSDFASLPFNYPTSSQFVQRKPRAFARDLQSPIWPGPAFSPPTSFPTTLILAHFVPVTWASC